MIGIQVGAVSFVDEGTEKVLDILQERGGVNTLFLAVFTYGRGIAGRQIPGQPLPDHGKQEYDLNFHGGNFATPHPQYYKNTVLQNLRAPDHGNLDILAEVLPAAKKRGMKVICWLEDVFRDDLPNIKKVQEVDLHGRNADTLCVNNPDYRNFLTGLVEDYARSYDIDGIMWGSERQGALCDSLGATHDTPPIDPGNVTCFCQFCQAKAKDRGINPERARQGFLELEKYVLASRGGQRPVDGYYVQFWRLLLRYPELAAWEMLWTDSLRETYAAIYKTVKTAKADVPVGWHIWHNNSFNPIYRAEQDLHELSHYSDFIKVVMYNNVGGERMALYDDNIHTTMYRRPDQTAIARLRLCGDEPERAQLRRDSAHRAFVGLRLSRGQAIARRRRRDEDADLARHRHRHSDRSGPQQVHSAERESRGAGGVSRGRAGSDPVAQIFGDEAGQPRRRR